jgi:hypothetical protein
LTGLNFGFASTALSDITLAVNRQRDVEPDLVGQTGQLRNQLLLGHSREPIRIILLPNHPFPPAHAGFGHLSEKNHGFRFEGIFKTEFATKQPL